MALALARAGWQVAVHYRDSHDDAMQTVAECAAISGDSAAFDADFFDEDTVRSLMPRVVGHFGRIDAVVNNASVLGWRAQKGQAHYAAAKAGVMAFTRCSAVEAAEFGVRINAVAPSIAMHAFLAKVTSDELLAELAAKEAFGRPAEVWEVANAMIFLASDLASYMTGEILSVSSQRA